MSLHDLIRAAVLDGRMKDPWTTGDLLANAGLFEGFTQSNLRTQPPNRSVSLPDLDLGTGANAVNGARAPYLRVGMRGKAILYSVRERTDERGVKNPAAVSGERQGSVSDDTPVEVLVESDVIVNEVPTAPHLLGIQARQALVLLVEWMHREQPWDQRLRSYAWRNRTFEQTQLGLADIISQGTALTNCIRQGRAWSREDEVRAVTWAEGIFVWGGTRQKSPVTWQKVRHTLTNAVLNRMEYPAAPMNSGYTKVASFGTAGFEDGSSGMPQVINDSRVATSLTCRLDVILREHGWLPADLFPGLGRVEAARGGSRPRPLSKDWPDAYQRWSGQFAATSVVLAMRDILNSDGRFPGMPYGEQDMPWTVRGIEAVLFMDGY